MFFIKLLKKIFIFFLILSLLLLIYTGVAYILTFFPYNSQLEQKSNETNETIYINYNQLHTNIIININNLEKSWAKNLPTDILQKKGFLSFGWGDKEFYLNTPTWDELKINSAVKALFINTPSVMHLQYYYRIDYFKNIKKVKLSTLQLRTIEENLFKSFDFNRSYKGFGKNDIFYDSPYQYNIFHTCNSWTGEQLRDANVSISYWTPFAYNIIDSLP